MYLTSQPIRRILFFICTILVSSSFISKFSAQVFAEESKWDELLALHKHKTKLIFSITEECTKCFWMFKYVDYLYQYKRDDVEVNVVISRRTGNTSINNALKTEFEKYGYVFQYYLIDDGSYENASFKKHPRTYIIDHKKLASEVYYEASKEHKEAILGLVKKEAQKSIIEVNALYRNSEKIFRKND